MSFEALQHEINVLRASLSVETDQARRILILRQIRSAEQELVAAIRAEQEQLEQERRNMQTAIDKLTAKRDAHKKF
jgi:wobble nucleotide-excising tRNase